MKILDILKQRDSGVSFELFPPKTEKGKSALAATIPVLKKYNSLYVSMTCGALGSKQDKTKEAVDMLLDAGDLEVMPHLTCIDITPDVVTNILDEYKSRGVDNIMALRGDPPLDVKDFDFSKQSFSYAMDLVKLIKQYGHFCIGVAVYPEGHIETSSLDEDIEHTKIKIDAGADFAVTQMFFDNSYFYSLMDRMKKKGISIPVLPGIFPLTDINKVRQFASVCRTKIPANIEDAMTKASDNPDGMEKIGLEFTIKQCQDLIDNGAKKLHFFTFNKPHIIDTILGALSF
jgi:methylenetetrahydrofolate reductase (NADPH)